MIERPAQGNLDPEQRLRELWADGVTRGRIAEELGISVSTVDSHVRRLDLPSRKPGRRSLIDQLRQDAARGGTRPELVDEHALTGGQWVGRNGIMVWERAS